MTTATQHISSNPARDVANAILAETDNAREIIYMLHDIAQGIHEDATTNDRIHASRILFDRGIGKCPKQSPATPNPGHAPVTDDTDVEPAPYSIPGAIRESSPGIPSSEPDSPRLVTQLDDSLHDSLGPAPSAHTSTRHSRAQPALVPRHGGGKPESYDISNSPGEPDPYSIREENHISSELFDPYSIQKYILEITNNCRTLVTALADIYRAHDDPRVKHSHRVSAGRILLDRVMGTNPSLVLSALQAGSSAHPERSPVVGKTEEEPFDREVWEGIIAELNQMEEDGIITPDPDAPDVDMSIYMPPEDFDMTPYEEEAAAAFRAENKLRLERRKKWPEIEERRRQKLARIYPSHSEDEPAET